MTLDITDLLVEEACRVAGQGLVSNRISPRSVSALAELEICEGGIIAKRRSLSPVVAPVGLLRGSIRGFSVASRGRLIRRLMRLDWPGLIGSKHSVFVQGLFITLTYPDIFPDASERWKRDIDTWFKRLSRKFSGVSVVWKMEIKTRKTGVNSGQSAPHFHLLFYSDTPLNLGDFRSWLSLSWYEVVGSDDEKHLRAGTQAKRIYGTVGKLLSYCSKYLAKEFVSDLETGRVWGEVGEVPRGAVVRQWVIYPELCRRLRRWGRGSRYLSLLSVWRNGFVVFGVTGALIRGILSVAPPISLDRLADIQVIDRQVIEVIAPRRYARELQIKNARISAGLSST